MAGYYSQRGAEGTHDPLFAKALVVEKDGNRAALVSLDLISTTFGMVEESRKLIEQQTGIPGSHVMISATHSHTGPVLSDRKPRTAPSTPCRGSRPSSTSRRPCRGAWRS